MLTQGKAESINQLISCHQHFFTVFAAQTLETKMLSDCHTHRSHLHCSNTHSKFYIVFVQTSLKNYVISVFIYFCFQLIGVHFVNVFSKVQHFFVHSNLYLSPLLPPLSLSHSFFQLPRTHFRGYYCWLKVCFGACCTP